MKYRLLLCFYFIPIVIFAQDNNLRTFRITSSHTSFPDTARAAGHLYNNILYDAASHYMDSSVLIVVPPKLNSNKKVDLVFWFHGWLNNIDSAADRFQLIKQFVASNVNAVLVLSETTRNAPDSYGGKLEQENVFKGLVTDVMQELKKEKVVPVKAEPRNILLAGHSGAYRVMANILQNGNMPVEEVVLFDALYGETNKFINWITASNSHRFIDIFTNGGGTDGESKELVKKLAAINWQADTIEENELSPSLLVKQKIVFIHSLHLHNDIINNPDNFQLFLENTEFLEKKRGSPVIR